MSVFFYLGISDLVHFYDNSLDNSSSDIFQVFAYDQYSQLQHRVIRTLSLDVSSQEASSEEISITLLASRVIGISFWRDAGMFLSGSPVGKAEHSCLNEQGDYFPELTPWRTLLPWANSLRNSSGDTCQLSSYAHSVLLDVTLSCLESFGDQYNLQCLARILWPSSSFTLPSHSILSSITHTSQQTETERTPQGFFLIMFGGFGRASYKHTLIELPPGHIAAFVQRMT